MWSTATCCRISRKPTALGWKRCVKRSQTMPGCWQRRRIRRSRTRCIWRCRRRDFSTRTTTERSRTELSIVMAGPVPAIHVTRARKTWMPGTRPGMTNTDTEDVMGFKCGIVGLPNVGKSTLFNALTETAAAQAANYPFCTIEPNVGEVAVPDQRLDKRAGIGKSAQIIPTRLTFVDIAGLVRGASKGEGLGNQFLATIREVDAIAHVVRCFEDSDVTHVEGKIAPLADIETIETELMLADLDSLEKRVDNLAKKAKGNDKDAKEQLDLVNRALVLLREGKPARFLERKPEEQRAFGMLGLLTSKPVLYVCNVEEGSAAEGNKFSKLVM